jgi:hypothetical protein
MVTGIRDMPACLKLLKLMLVCAMGVNRAIAYPDGGIQASFPTIGCPKIPPITETPHRCCSCPFARFRSCFSHVRPQGGDWLPRP